MAILIDDLTKEEFRKVYPILFGQYNLRQYTDRPSCSDCKHLCFKPTGDKDDYTGEDYMKYWCALAPNENVPLEFLGLDWMVCDKHEKKI